MCRALFQHEADHRYLYRISHDKALFLDYFASFLASYAASSLGNKKYNECGTDLVAALNDDKRELLLSSNISFTEEDLYRMWIYRFDSLAMDFDFQRLTKTHSKEKVSNIREMLRDYKKYVARIESDSKRKTSDKILHVNLCWIYLGTMLPDKLLNTMCNFDPITAREGLLMSSALSKPTEGW